MSEHRKAPRIAAKQAGTVHVNGRADLSCTVRNVSNSGALLNFLNPVILPRAFDLKFDGNEQRVTVVWQSGRLAGVRFAMPLRGIAAPQKRAWPWSRKSAS